MKIFRLLSEAKVAEKAREEALEEILELLNTAGIELDQSYLNSEMKIRPYEGKDCFMRRELEVLKLQKSNYKISFWVNQLPEPLGLMKI